MIGLGLALSFYSQAPSQEAPSSGAWILASGLWDDGGVWDDTALWIDAITWILAAGVWADTGLWDDAALWVD